jgi:prepilin-type N-terminal cleavage/methylation domain-containing protein
MTTIATSKTQRTRGFTLLEVIIVVAIIAGVYAIALPNFSVQKESQISDRLGRLNEDVRAAFDLAVLTGKPHRLVFNIASGEYFLERSEQTNVYLADQAIEGGDLPPRQEKEKQAEADEQFKEYLTLAGETFKDSASDTPIPPVSPVLNAKDALRGPTWAPVEGQGWGLRNLGDYLVIKDMQTEHHARPLTREEAGENGIALVYFLPQGYVERTVIHIYYKLSDTEVDSETPPYTVIFEPYLGMAQINSGYEEVNVQAGH